MKGKTGVKWKEKQMGKYGWSREYLLCYTLLFILLCLAAFFPFFREGKGFIWTGSEWAGDGEAQYFPYLYYTGKWLREFLSGLLSGDGAGKLYDFCIGMGADIRTVVRFRPLDLIGSLVSADQTELLYGILTLLRMYLSGLSFSAFCFYWKKPGQAVLVGSMIYVFCGYVLKLGLEHPFFTVPMVLLPLLLIGAEQVLRRQSILFFSFITMMGFISNYYFMYMCSFAMAGYVLLRFFDLYREKRVRNFFAALGRLFSGYFLGIGMSAVFLLPTIQQLFSSARVDGDGAGASLWIYENTGRYINWFFDLVSPYRGTGSNTNLNYAVLVLPALVLLFVRRVRDRLPLKIAFLTEAVVLLVPAGGYVLGGFSNINNRWVFILSFTVSIICVSVFEDFGRWSRKQALVFCVILFVFGALCGYRFLTGKNDVYQMTALMELLLCGILFFVMQKRKISGIPFTGALLAAVCVSAAVGGYMTYSDKYGDLTGEFLDYGEAFSFYEESPMAEQTKQEDFYRTDTDTIWIGEENSSIVLDYQGISFYNSILNAGQMEYLTDTKNPGLNSMLRLLSLDGRTVPEALANVRYYVSEQGEEGAPCGFAAVDGRENLYENQYPLAFGYTYDAMMEKEDYEKLSPLEKQQVMLETAVVEENGAQQTDLDIVTGCEEEISVVSVLLPETGENVQLCEQGYAVGKGGGSISFVLEQNAETECYLSLKGLEWEKEYSTVTIQAGDLEKKLSLRAEGENYSLGQKDYLVNLGYSKEKRTETVRIYFPKKGTYRLERLEVCSAPMDQYISRVEERNKEALTDVVMENNRITGHASLTGQKLMVFSVLWDKGWKAYVDGEEAGLQRVNVMYLGLLLEPGDHEIELRYETPGLRTGAGISLINGGIFLLLLILWMRKRRKMKNAEKSEKQRKWRSNEEKKTERTIQTI